MYEHVWKHDYMCKKLIFLYAIYDHAIVGINILVNDSTFKWFIGRNKAAKW